MLHNNRLIRKAFSTLSSIDIKVAGILRNLLNSYIKKRSYRKPPPTQDEVWDSLFHNDLAIEHFIDDNIKITLHKDSILCKLIYFEFETTEIAFVKRYLKKDDVFLDIGSNIGLFSLHASPIVGKNGKIFAFEPTPSIFKRFLENIELNNFENIEPQNTGLSNKKEILEFNISKSGFDAWNSFADLDESKNAEKISVCVQTLDDFIIEKSLGEIALIKLDVEGWEKYVIEGSNALLRRDKPPVLLVEFTETNAFAAGYYLGEIFDLMKSYGYEWYSYKLENNLLIKEKKKLHYPYENLIAIKDLESCYSRLHMSL